MAPLILALQVFLAVPQGTQIINVHESIEKIADAAKLQGVMDKLGITSTVLHGIPADFLHYDESKELDLSDVEDNHEELAAAAKVYPEDFSFFCAVDPDDENRLELLEECFEEGALGIKFYAGYSYAHNIALDDPELNEFYERLAEKDGILMLPMNTSKYQTELENLLTLHPELKVICSHYCLSSKSLDRVRELLDAFPNLYVDTSFGHVDYAREGFQTMTDNHDEFTVFFEDYQDRILFATDTVVTSYEDKTEEWLISLYSDYLSMMTEREFESALDKGVFYHGLDLSVSAQRKVFWQNWSNLLE